MSQMGGTFVASVPAVPVGSMQAFAGSSAPTGWLLCNGTTASRTTYSNLFSVIGTTYGVGDGSTTFGLPDMRGRVPMGAGTGNQQGVFGSGVITGGISLAARTAGQFGGDERGQAHAHALTIANSGALPIYRSGAGAGGRWITTLGVGTGDYLLYGTDDNQINANTAIPGGGMLGTGGNVPPFVVLNYIIKAIPDTPRGGMTATFTPPIVTSLPLVPQFGDQVTLYNPTTAGYRMAQYSGSSWVLFPESTTITVDSSGRMTLPYQPSFKAYTNSSQINNPATGTTLVFNDTSYGGGHNIGGHYNTGNGRFTAPITGRYWFSFNMLTNPAYSTNDPGYVLIVIAINGAGKHYMAHNHNPGWIMEGSAIVLSLAQNDYVTMILDYGSGHYGTYSYFCGGLLG